LLIRPNLLILITDQQRYRRHWPDDAGWLRDLTPNDAELARTGLSFRNAFCNTAMCSPSRATLFTGTYPAQHGVTLTLTAADQHNFAKTGLLGFYIDGNITRLEDVMAAGTSETNCDVKVMVARWPTKSIIMWTSAGASLQSGSRPRDKENARRDCLEASAGQLSEDLGRFFKSQGG